MKTVKARKKVKIFLESVMKTVFYVKRAPLNSNVGFLTLPLLHALHVTQRNQSNFKYDFNPFLRVFNKEFPVNIQLIFNEYSMNILLNLKESIFRMPLEIFISALHS